MGFLLASKSPRRRELLTNLGIDYLVVKPKTDEISSGCYYPHIPFINAIAKAESVLPEHPDELVLSADTVIEFQDTVIGKPSSVEGAVERLKQFCGKSHIVTTAVCLRHYSKRIRGIFADSTVVKFRKLSGAEISRYLETVEPLDKAGAYGIQENGEMLIEKVDGSLDNVIGLPTEKLKKAIYSVGFNNLMTKRDPSGLLSS